MKYAYLLAAGLLASGGTAHAQASDSGTVDITAQVAGLCVLGPPSRAAIPLGQLVNTSGPRVGRIVAVPAQEISLPGSFCNFGGTTLTVSATALLNANDQPVQSGFARAVNLTATASNWATQNASATTAATASGASPTPPPASGGIQPTAKLSDVALTLSNFTVPSDLLLVAGAYSGSVTITLGPAATP